MEELKKKIEELESFNKETKIMFQRIQEALGIRVCDEKGDFVIMIKSPSKERTGIISGIMATMAKLKSSVEKISDEKKIIIPKF